MYLIASQQSIANNPRNHGSHKERKKHHHLLGGYLGGISDFTAKVMDTITVASNHGKVVARRAVCAPKPAS
jgi:hypothetical protein